MTDQAASGEEPDGTNCPDASPDLEEGGILYAFTANEIMDLRRLLLPNRMSRHDTKGEARLRQHAENIRERRGGKVLND